MTFLCTCTYIHTLSLSLTSERPGKERLALGGAIPGGFLEEAGFNSGGGKRRGKE